MLLTAMTYLCGSHSPGGESGEYDTRAFIAANRICIIGTGLWGHRVEWHLVIAHLSLNTHVPR